VSLAEYAFPVGHRKLLRGTFGFSSSDPAVIATSVDQANDPPTFVMEALAEGTARLAVLDASGAELDATRITAAKATALTMFSDTGTRAAIDSIQVAAGAELNVFVRADGPSGPLVTGSHWTWWTEDASIATLWDPGGALLVPNATAARLEDSMAFIYLQGKKSGLTRLHVADANAEAVISVVVP